MLQRTVQVEKLSLWLIPVLSGIYATLLGQDVNWDLQNYHLYNAYAWFDDTAQNDLLPAGVQTNYNPLLDVAWFWLHQYLSPQATAFILAVVQSLNCLLLYGISRIVLPELGLTPRLALPVALTGIISPGFMSELGTVMHDSLVSLFVMAALLLNLKLLTTPRSRKSWLFPAGAGLIAGIGCALKLVIATNTLALCLSLLLLPLRWKDKTAYACIFAALVLLGMGLSGGFWFYDTWQEYGNPVFPLFNNIFNGPLALPEAGKDARFLPRSVAELLAYPLVFAFDPARVSELPYKQYSWAVIYLFGLAFVLRRLASLLGKISSPVSLSPALLYLLFYWLISLFLWAGLFGIYRYLIPLALLIPLLMTVLMSGLGCSGKTTVAGLLAIAILNLIATWQAPDWGHAGWNEPFYKAETPSQLRGSSAILLMGQPLAWLVPALALDIPFIQAEPNFFASTAYFNRVQNMTRSRDNIHLIVDPDVYSLDATDSRLKELGYTLDSRLCETLSATLGTREFRYRFCPVSQN